MSVPLVFFTIVTRLVKLKKSLIPNTYRHPIEINRERQKEKFITQVANYHFLAFHSLHFLSIDMRFDKNSTATLLSFFRSFCGKFWNLRAFDDEVIYGRRRMLFGAISLWKQMASAGNRMKTLFISRTTNFDHNMKRAKDNDAPHLELTCHAKIGNGATVSNGHLKYFWW